MAKGLMVGSLGIPKQLPKSPASSGQRRSSGGGLRPVIPFGLDDGSVLDDDADDAPEMGPVPIGWSAPFATREGEKGLTKSRCVLIALHAPYSCIYLRSTLPSIHESRVINYVNISTTCCALLAR